MKSSHIQVSSSPVILGAGLPISDVITALKAAAEAAPEEYGLVPTSVKMPNGGKTIFFAGIAGSLLTTWSWLAVVVFEMSAPLEAT